MRSIACHLLSLCMWMPALQQIISSHISLALCGNRLKCKNWVKGSCWQSLWKTFSHLMHVSTHIWSIFRSDCEWAATQSDTYDSGIAKIQRIVATSSLRGFMHRNNWHLTQSTFFFGFDHFESEKCAYKKWQHVQIMFAHSIFHSL